MPLLTAACLFCSGDKTDLESPSLEIFQTRLDKVLCSLLWVTLLQQGVGLDDPQRSLPSPTIPGSASNRYELPPSVFYVIFSNAHLLPGFFFLKNTWKCYWNCQEVSFPLSSPEHLPSSLGKTNKAPHFQFNPYICSSQAGTRRW